MESTLQKPALVAATTAPKTKTIVYWIFTALFCLQMSFTAYAQLRLPQVAEMFTHLGFPDYFRVELSWAKLLGVVLLLAPVPARLKEWAYAGFAINIASALVAHFLMGDGPGVWSWAAATGVLWGSRTSSGAACRPRRCSYAKRSQIGARRVARTATVRVLTDYYFQHLTNGRNSLHARLAKLGGHATARADDRFNSSVGDAL